MNQDSDQPASAMDADSQVNDNSAPQTSDLEAPGHRPFRTWALQQDMVSLLGSDADWRARTPELGIDATRESDPDDVPGQAFLKQELVPDERFPVRTKTSIALWSAALITDTLNQYGPTGIHMSTDAFRLTIVSVIVALLAAALVYPRLSARPFAVVEQGFLGLAYLLIAFQCADTGGTESPYMVWLVFTVFYAAYLLPTKRAIVNVGISIAVGISTVLMDQTIGPDSYVAMLLLTLVIVSGLLAVTVLRQRSIERNVQRAVGFLAAADPLTGVANLRAFERFVEQLTEQSKTGFALLMVDMNGLKGANTVFGHETGDGMVVRLAKLMLQASRSHDQVVRIGGDEFAVVMPHSGENEVEAWRERFEQLVNDHNVKIRGRLPQISVNTGSAFFPDAGRTADDLIDAADRQMYEQRTPAVSPPFEIDVAAPAIAGRLLRSARFANTPRRTYEPVDVLGQAAANWVVVASLTLLTIFLAGSLVNKPAAIALGVFGFVNAALCLVALRVEKRKPLIGFIDLSTVLFGGMSLLATGGSESPIQLAALLPTAFYARFLHGRDAFLHVGALVVVYTVTFWGSGDVSPAGESLFATIITAMIVVTGILQFSSGSLIDALRIVRESATHDPLTSAPNLYAFRDDLTAAIDRASAVNVHQHRPALVIADIDDFRKLNTLGGHRGGDAILQQAVERVQSEIGDEGRVYRIGGDELAVLFEVERLADATETASRVRRSLEFRSNELPKDKQRVTASVGFAVWHSPLTAAEFVETVETALGQSKEEHGRTVPAGTNVML